MHYIGQNNDYDCGPAAVYNALSWAGVKRLNFKILRAALRCSSDLGGTLPADMHMFLKQCEYVTIHKIYHDISDVNILIDELQQPENKSKSAILRIQHGEDNTGSHWCFCTGVSEDHLFYVINLSIDGELYRKIPRDEMQMYVDKRFEYVGEVQCAAAFILSKEDKDE